MIPPVATPPGRMTRRAVARLVAGGLALRALGPANVAGRQATPAAEPMTTTAIEHVTVLPMTGEAAIPDATVVIDGGRIAAIATASDAAVPEGAARIDGTGKWMLPAFTDMHVHFVSEHYPDLGYGPVDSLAPYVANGVLRVANLASDEHTNALRDEVAADGLLAPRIVTARMVDGDPPLRGPEVATPLRTPAETRAAVSEIVAAGYDLIKVYSGLDLETYHALLEEAGAQGIRVVGHLPDREAAAAEAVVPGLALVSHAEEFAFRPGGQSDAAIAEYVELASAAGTGLISTLFLDEQLLAQTRDPSMLAGVEGLALVNPVELPFWFEENHYTAATSPERIAHLEAIVDFNRRLVKAFVDAGILVLAGTDSFIPGVVGGYALHEELGALARAGLTTDQVLQSATVDPGRWLGDPERNGTVEVGQRADLVLLDADPREDITNTRSIAAVVLDGRVLPRPELDALMADLAERYAPVREWFSPQATEILQDR